MRLVIVFVVIVGLVWGAFWLMRGDEPPSAASRLAEQDRIFDTNDPMRRACDLSDKILLRVWRGDYKQRSSDLMMVPNYPN